MANNAGRNWDPDLQRECNILVPFSEYISINCKVSQCKLRYLPDGMDYHLK